jgi:ABC-2 type transport system permease protein
VLLALLALCAVASGLQAVQSQRSTLQRLAEVQSAENAQLAAKYRSGGDAGMAAYGTAHLTLNPPGALAFAAIGQRDLQPFSLRVRALGLQAQLYESEAINPELAAAGRFDYAFVLVYLAPLFVLVLMHDLVSGEREAGRLRLLAAQPLRAGAPWRLRTLLRYGLVLLAVLLPFAIGALVSAVPSGAAVLVVLAAALYLAFWFGLSTLIAALMRNSAASAAVLLASFVVLTLVLPTLVNAAIARHLPLPGGSELALAQRREVHQAWDRPKGDTMEKFFRTYPDWRGTAPVTGRFHWKWYFAMHQAGDDAWRAKCRSTASSCWRATTGRNGAGRCWRRSMCRRCCTGWPAPTCRHSLPIRTASPLSTGRYASITTRTCSMSNRSGRPISRARRALKRWRPPPGRHGTAGWRSACWRQRPAPPAWA